MGLILCNKNTVSHPLYIKELYINLYSYEELCFVIYENPLLVTDGFVNDELFEFIRLDLEQPRFAQWLKKQSEDGFTDEDILCYILEYGDFYSEKETQKYRQILEDLKKLSPEGYIKKKADYMFGLGKFGKAIILYEKILSFDKMSTSFLGVVYQNLAAAYANMFLYGRAYENYIKAYEILQTEDILKSLYFLTLLEPKIHIGDSYEKEMRKEERIYWEKDYEALLNRATMSHEVEEVTTIFTKDSLKRKKLAMSKLIEWKSHYRNML